MNSPLLSRRSTSACLLVGIELVLALAFGCCFVVAGAGGGAWILGGIAAGAIVFYFYRSWYNSQAQPNRNSRKVGQILVGLTIGFSIQHSHLLSLSSQLPILGLLTLFLLACGGVIGLLYARLQKTDFLTATLATVPGNIGVMASIAADQGKDTSLVSLIQLIRFTTIILAVPIIANVSNPHSVSQIVSSLTESLFVFDPAYIGLLFILLIITTIAVRLGKKFKIPVAAFICPILVGLSFSSLIPSLPVLANFNFTLPPLVNLVGQMLLGTTIGEYWGINPKLEKRTIAIALVPVLLTFVAGFLTAGVAMLFTPWDWLTCLLVASPGGSPEMILIALALHHNVEIVAAGHLVRLLTINLSLPALISFASHLDNRAAKAQDQVDAPSYPTTSEIT